MFRPDLAAALRRRDPSKGGRPGFDPVLKFKMLVLQALHGLSLQQTSYLVRDRLSWLRFCGLRPGAEIPDPNTLWDFREALIAARALEPLFRRLERAISAAGYLPMSGQIIDATLVARRASATRKPRKRRSRRANRAGDLAGEGGQGGAKDTDARWTVKFSKARPAPDGTERPDIAIPTFGYKAHISIDRRHGVIRRHAVTDAAAHDGARLREGLIDPDNTASDVWADTAYRSKANEEYLRGIGKVSRIHVKKPVGKPMAKRTSRANARKSVVRARVEHPFAVLKGAMRLMVRTIGRARAEGTITFAAMAYNMKRWCWLNRKAAPA